MKRTLSLLLALVFVLAMTACGAEETPETTAAPTSAEAPALGLTDWTMDATAWSSPNGATVNLTATPVGYAEGYSASFIVRLEGDEIANIPCVYENGSYTASADLNAEDGYCYYVFMTAADGNTTEVAVNTPSAPTDETLINLADALSTTGTVTINAAGIDDGKLTVSDGSVQIQLPKLTLREGAVTCNQAVLILSYDDETVSDHTLALAEADETGLCSMDLSGVSFRVPDEMEDDHRLALRLDVTLSNGQSWSVSGGSWQYFDGDLLLAVG